MIDKQEAAKQIRGNKEYVADCEWLKGYNKACEDNAQFIEQMKGREIIHCKDCKHHCTHRCMDSIPREICDLNQTFYDDEEPWI
jgi:Zn-finger protein